MKKKDIVQAWRDEEFRASLTAEEQAQLDNPAGAVEVSAADLRRDVAGGLTSSRPIHFCSNISTC